MDIYRKLAERDRITIYDAYQRSCSPNCRDESMYFHEFLNQNYSYVRSFMPRSEHVTAITPVEQTNYCTKVPQMQVYESGGAGDCMFYSIGDAIGEQMKMARVMCGTGMEYFMNERFGGDFNTFKNILAADMTDEEAAQVNDAENIHFLSALIMQERNIWGNEFLLNCFLYSEYFERRFENAHGRGSVLGIVVVNAEGCQGGYPGMSLFHRQGRVPTHYIYLYRRNAHYQKMLYDYVYPGTLFENSPFLITAEMHDRYYDRYRREFNIRNA